MTAQVRLWGWLVCAAVLCCLTACAPAVAQPPPAPTEAEVTSIMNRYVAYQRDRLGLQFAPEWGEVRFYRFVSAADWVPVMTGCVAGLGVRGVTFYDDLTSSRDGGDDQYAALQRRAIGVCSLRYPLDGVRSYLMTNAQLDYLYSYYSNVLVPCLRSNGYRVLLPTRTEFTSFGSRQFYVWNPYEDASLMSIGSGDPGWPGERPPAAPDSELLVRKCPPRPPGMNALP